CPPSERCQSPGAQRCARQLASKDALGEARHVDQGIDIDAGGDAHFLAEEGQLFRGDVSWLAGKRTATEASNGRIEPSDAQLLPCIGVGDTKPSGVMQMKSDLELGPATANLPDDLLHARWSCPAHRIRKGHAARSHLCLVSDPEAVLN